MPRHSSPPSRHPGWSSATGPMSSPSTGSASRSSRVRSSGCWGPTAPASRRRSRSSPRSSSRMTGPRRSPGPMSSASPRRCGARIGVVGQRVAVDPDATGRENLELQGLLYGVGRQELRLRMDGLFESFGLTEVAGRMARTYSGGMQRKLDVAMGGLVHRPRVLFLDEPTTGLDPEARAELWAEIARLADTDGLTILLTTHYLEEADRLASRIAIVDRGRVVASGTPDDLKAELRGDAVLVELRDAEATRVAAAALAAVGGLAAPSIDGRALRARAEHGASAVPADRLGPGARRRGSRLRHRRATLARRRLPASYRPGVSATAGGVHRMTAIAQSMYMTRRHTARCCASRGSWPSRSMQPIIWLLLFGTLFRSVTEIPGFTTTRRISTTWCRGRRRGQHSSAGLEWHGPHRRHGAGAHGSLHGCSAASVCRHRRASRLRGPQPGGAGIDHRRAWPGCSVPASNPAWAGSPSW